MLLAVIAVLARRACTIPCAGRGRGTAYPEGTPLPIIVVPDILREKLGADGAQALVDLLNQGMGMTRGEFVVALDQRFSLFEEKFERRLAEEIGKVGKDAAGSEGRLTRWMFVFWVGQIAVVTGILFAFFRS